MGGNTVTKKIATASVDNIQLGTLSLAKKFATSPANTDLNDYMEDFDAVHYTNWNESEPDGTTHKRTYTFKQSFTNTNGVDPAPVVLENIPYGTTYSVYELTTSTCALPAFITTDGDSGHEASGEIGQESVSGAGDAASREAVITNTYKTQSLTIHKEFSGTGAPADTEYTFTVTLTAPTGTALSDYVYKVDGIPTALTGTNSNQLVAKITGTGTATISGIPYGALYYVEETDPNDSSTTTIGTDGSNYGINGRRYPATNTQTLGADGNVYFKNTYPDTATLTITKAITRDADLPSGMTLPADYTFTVNLHSEEEFGSYTQIKLTDKTRTNVVQNWTGNSVSNVSLTVAGVGTATITGLPSDTTFTVSENSGSKVHTTDVTAGQLGTVDIGNLITTRRQPTERSPICPTAQSTA